MIDDSWYARPDGLPEAEAAGGVVARVANGDVLIALAFEQIYDDAVLPKGHVEPGEDLQEAARREIAEEVGVEDLRFLAKLGVKERMDFNKTEWKRTHYFLYVTDQVDTTPQHSEQHSEMRWAPIEPVPKFFWPEQRALVEDNRAKIVDLVKGAFSA